MKIIFVGFALFLFGCTSKSQKGIRREVYMGFTLGSGRSEAINVFRKLVSENKILQYEDINYSEHRTSAGKDYYSSTVLLIPDTDSILGGLKIVYSDDLSEYFKNQVGLATVGNAPYYLIPTDKLEISDSYIADDIIKNIAANYKSYDKADTVTLEGTTYMSYYWNNRNDVDIELNHNVINYFDKVSNKSRHQYFIKLTYNYTDEMKKKIFKKKSIY